MNSVWAIGGTGVWRIGGLHQDLFKFGIAVASSPFHVDHWKNPILIIQSNADPTTPVQPIRDAINKLEANGTTVDQHWVEVDRFDVPGFVAAMRESCTAWWKKLTESGEK